MKKKLVVCLLVSEFHVAGCLSYINQASIQNFETDIVIIVNYHKASKGFRVDDKNFQLIKGANTKIIYNLKEKKALEIIEDETNPRIYDEILFINVMNYDLRTLLFFKYKYRIRNIEVVVIDEGLGMYMNPKIWEASLRKEEELYNISKNNNNKVISFIRKFALTIPKIFAKYLIKDITNKIEHFSLFYIENDSLLINNTIAEAYKKFYFKGKTNEYEYEEDIKKVLIISDNLASNLINQNEETNIYQDIIDMLTKKFTNIKIYLKPHPNELEDLIKFKGLSNCEVISKKISAEELFTNDPNIFLVIGLSSTSLLTASVIFKKDVVSIKRYLDKYQLTKLAEYRLNLFEKRVKHIEKIKFKL